MREGSSLGAASPEATSCIINIEYLECVAVMISATLVGSVASCTLPMRRVSDLADHLEGDTGLQSAPRQALLTPAEVVWFGLLSPAFHIAQHVTASSTRAPRDSPSRRLARGSRRGFTVIHTFGSFLLECRLLAGLLGFLRGAIDGQKRGGWVSGLRYSGSGLIHFL